MINNWIKVYVSTYLYKVTIAQSVLAEQNINSVIIDKQDKAYLFGEIELYTTKEDALVAVNLLKDIKFEEG